MTDSQGAFTEKSNTEKPAVRATKAGTRRYASRWEQGYSDDFYRPARTGLTFSSVAFGTYLGESDDETDALYASSLRQALGCGINVIDTAINYRCQRSERVIGRVLGELLASGDVRRDEVVVCTKAGYVALDQNPPATRDEYKQYLQREFFDRGVLAAGDLVAGGHALRPDFLIDQLQKSMRNLGVRSVDCFYIHNPEQQLAAISSVELTARLRVAFEALEACADRGEIGCYGCATWSALRLPAGSRGHISLFELVALAREVAGEGHRFKIVQLPINAGMSEAVRVSTQRDPKGRLITVVEAAAELGIDLVASAPLLQGKLTRDLPADLREMFPGTTDAQRAIAFVRSIPNVVTVAVGTMTPDHLSENLASLRQPSAGA